MNSRHDDEAEDEDCGGQTIVVCLHNAAFAHTNWLSEPRS